ncbi:MAG: hypothetical protein IPL09_10930 [Bacteroidetes bacterium]|jgi:hypothetical protein|nr:hypothetical protein [Bacteroidota bacterium]HQW47613.1 hypothetical protein [Chitinophagaceae bacterium]MBK7039890.1 hypothetical protein [Bacteroidota bacterium]MBK7589143.1 hypothetical protein [Bacteroidota bacterium]MBK8329959.1 hypothetical protein [Bacteroidota bacterium]
MNKKISTRVGLITGLMIMVFILVLRNLKLPEQSPLVFFQFLLLFIGIIASCLLLYRYYADIKFIDAFTHCIKTSITTLMIVILGNTILYFIFSNQGPITNYTFVLMKTIFAYTFSGLLSSFFTSFLFNTFTKYKK